MRHHITNFIFLVVAFSSCESHNEINEQKTFLGFEFGMNYEQYKKHESQFMRGDGLYEFLFHDGTRLYFSVSSDFATPQSGLTKITLSSHSRISARNMKQVYDLYKEKYGIPTTISKDTISFTSKILWKLNQQDIIINTEEAPKIPSKMYIIYKSKDTDRIFEEQRIERRKMIENKKKDI